MALGREILLVLFVAVSVSGFPPLGAPFPGFGGTSTGSSAWPGANLGPFQNLNDGAQVATTGSNSPFKLNPSFLAGCSCREVTHCSCEVEFSGTTQHLHFDFNPQIHVEFFDRNVSLRITIKNRDVVLLSQDLVAADMIPPLCVTIPQAAFILFCVEVESLTSSIVEQSARVCLIGEIRVTGAALLPGVLPPALPIGCFSASLGRGLAYTPPVPRIPAFQPPLPLQLPLQLPLPLPLPLPLHLPVDKPFNSPLNSEVLRPFDTTASLKAQKKKSDITPIKLA